MALAAPRACESGSTANPSTSTSSPTTPRPVSLNGLLETGNSAFGERFKGRIDDLRFYDRPLGPEEIDRLALHYPIDVLLSTTPPSRRNKDQDRQVRAYYFRFAAPEPLRQAAAEYKELDDQREDLEFTTVSTMVMKESITPRDTYVLARGDYSQPKREGHRRRSASLPPLPPGRPANRLGLADWLVDPNHPLTSRVAVNRFWQMVFGTGIVKTAEDFGSQGEPPSNPELLDWLATEFVRTDWDVKGMLKLIVTSATYRQSSKVTPALHDRDPENRLLARGPRARLPAETRPRQRPRRQRTPSRKIGGPERPTLPARRTLGRTRFRRRLLLRRPMTRTTATNSTAAACTPSGNAPRRLLP